MKARRMKQSAPEPLASSRRGGSQGAVAIPTLPLANKPDGAANAATTVAINVSDRQRRQLLAERRAVAVSLSLMLRGVGGPRSRAAGGCESRMQ